MRTTSISHEFNTRKAITTLYTLTLCFAATIASTVLHLSPQLIMLRNPKPFASLKMVGVSNPLLASLYVISNCAAFLIVLVSISFIIRYKCMLACSDSCNAGCLTVNVTSISLFTRKGCESSYKGVNGL